MKTKINGGKKKIMKTKKKKTKKKAVSSTRQAYANGHIWSKTIIIIIIFEKNKDDDHPPIHWQNGRCYFLPLCLFLLSGPSCNRNKV